MTAPLAVERVGFDALGDDWDELALAARNVFGTRLWAETWWRHHGGGSELLLHACRRADGTLAGVLPLHLWRGRPLRVARFLGHPMGDELGPVCAPADRGAVAVAARDALARAGVHVLLGEQLSPAGAWSGVLGGRAVARGSTPLLRWEGGWEELLRARSRNFREQVRRRERKLAKAHELAYRATTPETLEGDLDTLFRLHRARWGDASGFAVAEPFHRDVARAAAVRGWLRLWLLEVDGEPRAAWYGFRFAGAECYYQAGRDPDWEEWSVGFLVLVHSIRAAFDDGLSEYRLLRGGEEYKSRFSNEDPGLETVLVGRGALGRAAVAAAAAVPRGLARRVAG